ncbi:sulfur carrier protein ThiS [Virgibacillus necropolis]|uniref:sulfur carrier protein ThiS n=1 Tax=Virgibacillus necropolis TaxID=163877 RepID=UPI00384B8AAA
MNLRINGKVVQVPEEVTTISNLIMHFNINHSVVIAELNGKILDKENHPLSVVEDGDKVELVQFVGGG